MPGTTLCDRDGIAAATHVVFTPAGPLAFCAHHYRQHRPALAGYPSESLTETARGSERSMPPAHAGRHRFSGPSR
jgi:hypothetical protein